MFSLLGFICNDVNQNQVFRWGGRPHSFSGIWGVLRLFLAILGVFGGYFGVWGWGGSFKSGLKAFWGRFKDIMGTNRRCRCVGGN